MFLRVYVTVTVLEERREAEHLDQDQFELQRRQRAEERQWLDEEAREREQQALRELQIQQQVSHHVLSVYAKCDCLCLGLLMAIFQN